MVVITSRYRRPVPAFSLWLTVLAVFYLTIGVHLLHPLFHQQHDSADNHALTYHHSEHHHHTPCPLHDYCQTIHHLDLTDAADYLSVSVLADGDIALPHQQISFHHTTTPPARAPPVA